MSTTVYNYPSDFYDLMEKQRENLPGIISRENYVPIFIIETLQGQLLTTNYQHDQNSITRTWNRDSLLTDNPDLESRFLIPNVEIKYFIKSLLVFASLIKKTPGIGYNENELNELFYNRIKFPSLELIWFITCSKYKLFSFTSYIVKFQSSQREQEFFTNQLVDFCFSSYLFEKTVKRKSIKMLQDFLPEILIAAYSNPVSNEALLRLKKHTDEILKNITRRLLSKETMVCSFMTRQLILAILAGVALPNSIKKKYVTHQLDGILSQQSPELSPRDILRQQEKFAGPVEIENSAKWETISAFIKEPPLTKAEILDMLQKHIRNRAGNLNWESLLLIITILAKNEDSYASSVFRLLKEAVHSLMVYGLSEKKEVDVLAAFILARHCCLISPQNFARYEKWYTGIFGNETSPARTPETFTYLASVLSSWTPIEPVCFLQVHATYWPHIPTGMRLIWSEYVKVSKLRIAEYNEVEQTMAYEPNPNNPIQYDIEMILKSFDSRKKIPEAISKMLMFRKSYYYEQFLPALLRKSHGFPLSALRLRLIEALNADGKIPKNLYKTYKESTSKWLKFC